ncbi:MAG TPA: hypothetical protein VFS66_01445 [Acidimicrobiia bacterium]|nr:hypothetical protein [Acidimicrobiia bacterium]
MSSPPTTITCVECGGVAHLASFLPEDEDLDAGYPLAYICVDCNHRHDLVWEDEDPD